MKISMKRLISFCLALVLLFALVPQNIIPTIVRGESNAPSSMEMTAYPKKVAVGQTAALFVYDGDGNPIDLADLTITSSNNAIATVENGTVTGVHSGNVTLTATYNDSDVSTTLQMQVTATSIYNFGSNAFSFGNDTSDPADGIVDDVGGTKYQFDNGSAITPPEYGFKPSTNSVDYYIPFYVTGGNSNGDGYFSIPGASPNGYGHYRGRESIMYLYPIYGEFYGGNCTYSAYAQNEKYFTSYDYLNLNNTAPWHWMLNYSHFDNRGSGGNYGLKTTSRHDNSKLWIDAYYHSDRYVNITFKIEVPATGDYLVDVDLGAKSGLREVFFLVPAADYTAAANDRAILCNDAYKLFEIDAPTTTTGSTTWSLEKGSYYFVVAIDKNCSETTLGRDRAYLKSLSLTLEEKGDAILSAKKDKLILGQQTTLAVTQNSTTEGEIIVPGVVYTADDDGKFISLETLNDGTAKVTALSSGTVKVTAVFTHEGQPYTQDVTITVTNELLYNITTGAFNVGNDTEGDLLVDEFNAPGMSVINDWYNKKDKNVDHYIPFYVYGSGNSGVVCARPNVGWMLYPNRNGSYVTPNYQNPAKTEPWTWFTTGNIDSASYLNHGSSYIQYGNISEGNEPYFVVKLEVPVAGKYVVNVDTGHTSARAHNEHFYLIPGNVIENAQTLDRTLLFDTDYYLGNIDSGSSGPYAKDFTGYATENGEQEIYLTAGSHYFVTKINNDGEKTDATGNYVFFKSIKLILNQMEGIFFEDETLTIEKDDSVDLKVFEKWSVSDPVEITSGLTFTSDDPDIATVDNTGKLIGISNGSTVITVEYGEYTAKIYVVVNYNELISVTPSVNIEELEAGKTTQIILNEIWSVKGDDVGSAEFYDFASSDTNIAIIDADGKIIGVGNGKVTITVTSKVNTAVSNTVDLIVLTEQPSGDSFVLDYNFSSNSFNIGNDFEGDGIIDDFGDSKQVANGLLSENMFNTWTDKNAPYFIPYYATGSTDSITSNADATTNGYAWARVREGTWRLYPVWSDSSFANNKPYFTQYRYQNGKNTAYWQWTEYNAGINASQTYLMTGNTHIRPSSNNITDGSEPFVTLKLNVPAAGTYHFTLRAGATGKANLYCYIVPVSAVDEPSRDTLIKDEYLIGSLDTVRSTTVRYDNAFTAQQAGEYYLVVKLDNDNWEAGEAGYPTSADQWDVYLKSVSLIMDKQTGIEVSTNKNVLRVDGYAQLTVVEQWMAEGPKLILNPARSGVTFESSDTNIATVDATGKIVAVGNGTATITVKQNGFTEAVEIKVDGSATLQKVSISAPRKRINIARSIVLSIEETWSVGGVEVVEDLAANYTFASSNNGVATVDENGKVTGVGTGKVKITATHKSTGKVGSIELEVDGVLTYNILTSSFNIANYDSTTGTYDFGDMNTTEPMFSWFESKNMFNTWTDKNASKFIPFYAQDANDKNSTNPSASSNGYAYARVREGLWRLYPIYARYSSNKDYFTSYDYLNESNTSLWQWTPYNVGIDATQTYITQNFTWVSAPNFTDGNEPYITLKLNIPAAGLYTLGVNSEGNANLYFYMVPASAVTDANRETLTNSAYCIGAPLNTAKNTSISYNGGFVAEEAGEYYFVIKMDSDHLAAGEQAPGTWTMRLKNIILTPDKYVGISMTAPIYEIEPGWYVDTTIKGLWAAGGRDSFDSYAKYFTFRSNNTKIATVDANGRIYGVGKGTATITAKEKATGFSTTIKVTVKDKGECNQDVYLYFSDASSSNFSDITIERDGWKFNFERSSSYAAKGSVYSWGLYLTNRHVQNNAAIDIYVPHDGYYRFVLVGIFRMNNTGNADIYIDGVYAGNIEYKGKSDFVAVSTSQRTIYLTTGIHTFNFVPRAQSGNSVDNYNYVTLGSLGLLAENAMPEITELKANELFLAPGASSVPNISVTTSDGFNYSTATQPEMPYGIIKNLTVYNDPYIKVKYTVASGDDVVRVSQNGQVVALKVGQALLNAEVSYLDAFGKVIETDTVEVPVTVSVTGEDPRASQLTKLDITGPWYDKLSAFSQAVFELSLNRSTTYYVRGINALGTEMNMADAKYSWSVSDSSVLSISSDADSYLVVTAKAVGKCTVTLKVTVGEKTVTRTFTVTTRDGKTGRSIYTDEMIETARKNIEEFEWAQTIRDAAVSKAQRYMGYDLSTLWNNVTSQGIPRSYNVSFDNDPEMYYCRYCKTNLYTKYGNYPYVCDPFRNMWKISCPECKHSFPTNDFGSFYELGRTAANNGKFDRMTALEAHRQMLISKNLLSAEARAMAKPTMEEDGTAQWKLYYGYGVKGGYLYNETCPGVGTASDSKATLSPWETVGGWGVDDGMGYFTGRTWPTGAQEVYTFIAYYNHFATWFGGSNILIVGGIDACADAYLYTGDERYARVACILLDRVADIYPDLNLKPYTKYPNNDGGTNNGHALGRIWETLMAVILPEAYDIVYPMFDDPEVLAFLNSQGQKWGYGNGKDSADKIRENIETGILREIYEAAKRAEIQGNFGLHQSAVAAAAVVLDTYPDTQEMIDWLFQYAVSDARTYNTGGDINNRLVQIIYRDGQNYESPYYNEMGISNFGDTAAFLQMYQGYEGESIYENPKYLQMINSYQLMTLIRRGTKAIGDANYAFAYTRYPSQTALQEAFFYLKDNEEVRPAVVKIAQHLYYLNSGIFDGMHYNVFTEDPESFADDIKAIIDEYGEYDYDKSSILTGYGIGILRDGTLYAKGTREGMLLDTTRDFTINFSGHYGHNHTDLLDLGMEAFGLGMTTDLGYPETPNGGDPHSSQWSGATIGHNTVVVDEYSQVTDGEVGIPLHYDALDHRVKVMDVSAAQAYGITDEYRRTIIMIDYNDDISYGIDFFRVIGGSDHMYTFMPASDEHPLVSDNIANAFVTQNGGTYAGVNVPHGQDPNTGIANKLAYPTGYTWMYDVDKATNPGVNEFWLDYQIKDFREYSRNDKEDGSEKIDVRLRVTMLNDFAPNEISLVSTTPQRINNNRMIDHLEKFLIRRNGYDLDSLFTTVYEPYEEGKRYISAIDSAPLKVSVVDGEPSEDDVAKAVRVYINDGNGNIRYDYVIYATNTNVTYKVEDPTRNVSFSFRGFVGVWSTDDAGVNTYSYVNDGDFIGDTESDTAYSFACKEITGKIQDWQHDLSVSNWLDVVFTEPISESQVRSLKDRMIDVERSAPGNSCFMIEDVTYELNSAGLVESARLDLGTITTISGYVNVRDVSMGYTYDVFENANFTVKLSYEGGDPADYSQLDAEIEIYNSLNSDDYTVDSWLRYTIAIEKAMKISRDLKSIDQDIIDDAVNNIRQLRDELVSKMKPATPSVDNEPSNDSTLLIVLGASLVVVLGGISVILVVIRKRKAKTPNSAE